MKGVDRHGLNWDQPLPAKLTIQIGSMVDVFPAQLAIETLLEYGPKDIGVVVLGEDNIGLGLTMLVGDNPVGYYHVYTGSSIQDLLVPGLSAEAFRKFAQSEKTSGECSKEMMSSIDSKYGCVSVGVPLGSTTCDMRCQTEVVSKLFTAGVSVRFSAHFSLKNEVGCVGFRQDLGGTEGGAKCIAKILGYEFHSSGCNGDGYPYNVRVR